MVSDDLEHCHFNFKSLRFLLNTHCRRIVNNGLILGGNMEGKLRLCRSILHYYTAVSVVFESKEAESR